MYHLRLLSILTDWRCPNTKRLQNARVPPDFQKNVHKFLASGSIEICIRMRPDVMASLAPFLSIIPSHILLSSYEPHLRNRRRNMPPLYPID